MICSSMPELDGKDQGEDIPKQAFSCWFARHSWLATSDANLYPPGIWFADVILSFSGVPFDFFLVFVSCSFVFVLLFGVLDSQCWTIIW